MDDLCSAEKLVEFRRDLHRFPELRFEEYRTSAKISDFLEEVGWVVARDPESTGLVATWPQATVNVQILVRADIDAYPVNDGKSVSYSSQNPGVAHACGHDVHVTAALGLACRIAQNPVVRDSVAILFQPAEEIPFGATSGAQRMLDSGLLRKHYLAVIGLHCWPLLEAGSVGVDVGPAMAAKDAFEIKFNGLSTHAATPALSHDSLLAAAEAIMSLHAGVARVRNPHELLAFNIGTILGGQSQSAVPDLVAITGTLRTHDQQVRGRLKKVIERIAHNSGAKYEVDIELTWANEMPPVINSEGLVALALDVLRATKHRVVELREPPMTSDDFSLLAVLGPTLYFKLGVAPMGGGQVVPLHTAAFDVDESCIPVAVDALESVVIGALDAAGRGESLA